MSHDDMTLGDDEIVTSGAGPAAETGDADTGDSDTDTTDADTTDADTGDADGDADSDDT